jgi:hypothetical protein
MEVLLFMSLGGAMSNRLALLNHEGARLSRRKPRCVDFSDGDRNVPGFEFSFGIKRDDDKTNWSSVAVEGSYFCERAMSTNSASGARREEDHAC